MPSAKACSRSAAKRALDSCGMILPPPARWSRYSTITRESNSVEPSSVTSAGILPTGFCTRSESPASLGSALSRRIWSLRPSTLAARMHLRANGDGGRERKIIMGVSLDGVTLIVSFTGAAAGGRVDHGRSSSHALKAKACARSSAGDDKVHGLWPLALLVGLDFKLDSLSFIERLQSSLLDRGDVHEHIASAIVRFDKAVAAFTVEELDRTAHGHRKLPPPAKAPPPTHTVRRLGRTFTSEEVVSPQRPQSLRRSPRWRRNV